MDAAVLSPGRDPLAAVGAIVVHVLEPTTQARKAGCTDADQAQDNTTDSDSRVSKDGQNCALFVACEAHVVMLVSSLSTLVWTLCRQ